MYKSRVISTQYVDSEELLNKSLKEIAKGKLLFTASVEDKIVLIWEDPDLIRT